MHVLEDLLDVLGDVLSRYDPRARLPEILLPTSLGSYLDEEGDIVMPGDILTTAILTLNANEPQGSPFEELLDRFADAWRAFAEADSHRGTLTCPGSEFYPPALLRQVSCICEADICPTRVLRVASTQHVLTLWDVLALASGNHMVCEQALGYDPAGNPDEEDEWDDEEGWDGDLSDEDWEDDEDEDGDDEGVEPLDGPTGHRTPFRGQFPVMIDPKAKPN